MGHAATAWERGQRARTVVALRSQTWPDGPTEGARARRHAAVPFWPGFSLFVAALTLAAAVLVATYVAVYAARQGRGVSMRVVVPSIGSQAPSLLVTVSPRSSSVLPPPVVFSSSSGTGASGEAAAAPAGSPTPAPTPTPAICTLSPACAPGPERQEPPRGSAGALVEGREAALGRVVGVLQYLPR
jgi:hypothetical protein